MRLHIHPAPYRRFLPLVGFILVTGLCYTITFLANTHIVQSAAVDQWEITYQIDRSQVPELYANNLTLQLDVGSAISVSVQVDSLPIPSTYTPATGIVQFTTSGQHIDLFIDGAAEANMPPAIAKAPLLENKKWAWSHGFDDNVFLKPSIAAFDSYDWEATVFMITSSIDETRQEDWIVDQPDLLNYLADGWGVGSHGHAPDCSDDNTADQLTALGTLAAIVDDSAVPDYKVTSFAVPCFDTDYYSVIDSIIQGGSTDLQFYESGNDYLRLVDTPHIRPHDSTDLPTYTASNITASGLELMGPLGRDYNIEQTGYGINSVLAHFDWMATNAAEDRHFWYNTLAHGNHEDTIGQALTYVFNNYGPNGTDEAWVAPSDRIYSYILVRDNSHINQTSIKKDGVLWIPPSATTLPTGVPTGTSTETPTDFPTDTPTEMLTLIPTELPTETPIETPTLIPTGVPTQGLTETPPLVSTDLPTKIATETPVGTPTQIPSPTADDPSGDTAYLVFLPITLK